LLAVIFSSCAQQEKFRPGGPYYFEGWTTYQIPFHPEKEITPDKAKLLRAYYIAYFNEDKKLTSFTKYLDGKLEFSDKYIYNSKGSLVRREMTKYTGEFITQYWNINENLLREDTTQTDSSIIIKYINKKGEVFQERIIKAGNL